MRVIVVHEDGDRTSRITELADQLRVFIAEGSSYAVLCDRVEIQSEGDLR